MVVDLPCGILIVIRTLLLLLLVLVRLLFLSSIKVIEFHQKAFDLVNRQLRGTALPKVIFFSSSTTRKGPVLKSDKFFFCLNLSFVIPKLTVKDFLS